MSAPLVPPPRLGKPRRRGLTSIIDFGPDAFGWTGPRGVADLLDCAGEYVDFAKIYAMNALLMPEETVRQVVRLYRDAGVRPFTGGILFEYAHTRGEIDGLFDLLERIGITGAEVSENYVTLADDERRRVIDRFQARGLSVVYEFGRKNPEEPMDMDRLALLVDELAGQGVEHVIVEQSEFDLAERSRPGIAAEMAARPWFERILVEADPFRFPQQHVALLRDFGPEVNLANVAPGQALRLEGFRRGVGRAVDYALLRELGVGGSGTAGSGAGNG
jgi:phosphosulfolactate synthase